MVDLLTIAWILGGIGIASYSVNLIRLMKIISKVKSISVRTHEALRYMSVTFICLMVNLAVVLVLGLMRIEITSKLWLIFIVIYILIAFSWGIGTYKLLEIVTENG